MMTREVYTDKKFIEFSQKHIFVRVFEDKESEGKRLARKFGIGGFPTMIVLDSKGAEIDRIEGAMRAKDLMEELQLIFASTGRTRISI
jgi:thioredoxin-related protein